MYEKEKYLLECQGARAGEVSAVPMSGGREMNSLGGYLSRADWAIDGNYLFPF